MLSLRMTAPLGPAEIDQLARFFRYFAERECSNDPLYVALCHVSAEEPALLSLLSAAEVRQRRPNLLLAAVHATILRLGASERLGDYFASIGGSRPVDDALHRIFLDFAQSHRDALLALLGTRTTQTNEIGRCAAFWPVLELAASLAGSARVAILDFGSSAGLNLGVDFYGYDYGATATAKAARGNAPTIRSSFIGGGRPSEATTPPTVVERLGVDVAPLDLANEDDRTWLKACVWPSDTERRERLSAAIPLALEQRWRVARHEDCTAATIAWARNIDETLHPVILNSWVLTYLSEEARKRHVTALHDLVAERGASWVSAEGSALRISDDLAPPLDDSASPDQPGSSHWILSRRVGGRSVSTLVARSHPHGTWIDWLGV